MSFEVKNIEQENIDVKKLIPIAIILIISVIASAIFVYYWFTLETRKVMQEQYLGRDSSLRLEFNKKEIEKMNKLDMESAKKEIEDYYN
tara:strand:- start:296 stop:562 length:267 start_codon:yes stop_codon:yes gene_type:complete